MASVYNFDGELKYYVYMSVSRNSQVARANAVALRAIVDLECKKNPDMPNRIQIELDGKKIIVKTDKPWDKEFEEICNAITLAEKEFTVD
jgi:hypothetical protein